MNLNDPIDLGAGASGDIGRAVAFDLPAPSPKFSCWAAAWKGLLSLCVLEESAIWSRLI
jgi:hypothetical protein